MGWGGGGCPRGGECVLPRKKNKKKRSSKKKLVVGGWGGVHHLSWESQPTTPPQGLPTSSKQGVMAQKGGRGGKKRGKGMPKPSGMCRVFKKRGIFFFVIEKTLTKGGGGGNHHPHPKKFNVEQFSFCGVFHNELKLCGGENHPTYHWKRSKFT